MKVSKINASIDNCTLPINLDIQFVKNNIKKPIVVFSHGFKGFKDWGAWDLVAEKFAQNNFIFLKFNFSHNGTTKENLLDFENIKAFSENNYTKELEDLQKVIDWTSSKKFPLNENEFNNSIYLIGHSRGGGAAIIKSFESEKVKSFCTWASIDNFDRFGTKEQIALWEKKGEHVFINGRTGQKMPIKYQFYQDYIKNRERLDLKNTLKNNQKPFLIIHGTEDPAVSIECAENLYSWSSNSTIFKVEKANHVFDSSHPYLEKELPGLLNKVVTQTIAFFNS